MSRRAPPTLANCAENTITTKRTQESGHLQSTSTALQISLSVFEVGTREKGKRGNIYKSTGSYLSLVLLGREWRGRSMDQIY
jgi:hypothetical protein